MYINIVLCALVLIYLRKSVKSKLLLARRCNLIQLYRYTKNKLIAEIHIRTYTYMYMKIIELLLGLSTWP